MANHVALIEYMFRNNTDPKMTDEIVRIIHDSDRIGTIMINRKEADKMIRAVFSRGSTIQTVLDKYFTS